MNIFFLDSDPVLCARYHNNSHIVKMVIETAQLLATTQRLNNVPARMKSTHINHPCRIWTGISTHNYLWLCQLGIELAKEYTFRYGKIHKCEQDILEAKHFVPNLNMIGFTNPPLCFGENNNDCIANSPVESYRNYYRKAKRHLAKWKKRNPPEWWF